MGQTAGIPSFSEAIVESELAAPLLADQSDETENEIADVEDVNEPNDAQSTDEEQQSSVVSANDVNEHHSTSFLHKPLLPFTCVSIGGITVVDGEVVCRFLKFAVLTTLQLVLTHSVIRWLDWEYDQENSLKAILVYQSNLLWLDGAVFFVVGRSPQVDTVAWVSTSTAAALFLSWINRFKFLQHAATLYEMHCTWPWMTWVYALFVLLLCIVMVVLHVRYALMKRRLVSKLLEAVTTALAVFGPSLFFSSSNFHLHHWLAGWWIGMHLSFPTGWSRICMAWCWGIYINGIAVYGRDPMLVCEYIDYYARDQHCHASEWITLQNDDEPVDWRNCSASGYHP